MGCTNSTACVAVSVVPSSPKAEQQQSASKSPVRLVEVAPAPAAPPEPPAPCIVGHSRQLVDEYDVGKQIGKYVIPHV
jgi:hypothetical protein